MKLLVLAACILIAVAKVPIPTRSNNALKCIYEQNKECCNALNCAEKYQPEVVYCTFKRYNSNAFDENGMVIIEEFKSTLEEILKDSDLKDEVLSAINKCYEKGLKAEGTDYEKVLKMAKCSQPIWKAVF